LSQEIFVYKIVNSIGTWNVTGGIDATCLVDIGGTLKRDWDVNDRTERLTHSDNPKSKSETKLYIISRRPRDAMKRAGSLFDYLSISRQTYLVTH